MLLCSPFFPRLASADPMGQKTATLTVQLDLVQRELMGQETSREQVQRELALRESDQAKLVEQIEQLKAQPPGPVRDLRLQSLLAQAQDRADDLSQRAAARKTLHANVATLQKRLLSLCERVLAGEDGAVDSGRRVQLLRLRAQLTERLYGDEPERLRALTQSSAALEKETPSDDPQGLRDRADLLRDSADKLLREMAKLKERRQALLARQRVRQRAATVDEDLFAEQATARRGGGVFSGRETKAADAAAAPTVGGTPTPPPTPDPGTASGPTTSLRTALDPSTLDALLRSDGSGDAGAQAAALQRAEGELRSLVEQLQRRATQLEQRAVTLRNQK
jgi:hypothetical protein